MKPNFALNLSHEGIVLLHRAKAGWLSVGEVHLNAADLKEQLAVLRQTAANLDPTGLSSKLVIPNSQVLYTEIRSDATNEAARLAQIREGLVGLTPYDVNDLVFDWRAKGETVQLAVVAKETLREAEAFAAEFRFNPVSFVAVANPEFFMGEPFFGPTDAASSILEAGDAVEPDDEMTDILQPKHFAAAPKRKAPPPAPVAAASEASLDPKPKSRGAKKKTKPKAGPTPDAPASLQEPTPEFVTAREAETPAPTFASRRATAEPKLTAKAPPAPPAKPIPVAAPIAVESASNPRATVAMYSALDIDDVPDMPAAHRPNGQDTAMNGALAVTAGATVADASAPAPALPEKPAKRMPLLGMGSGGTSRRSKRKQAIAASSEEAHALTVFGERKSKPVVGGKPRFLGLALTFLLLIALGVAALWSSLASQDPDTEEPTEQIAAITPSDPIQEEGAAPAASAENGAGATTDAPLPSDVAPRLDSSSPEFAAPGLDPDGPAAPDASGGEAPSPNLIDAAVGSALGIAPEPETEVTGTEPAAPLTRQPDAETPATGNDGEVEVARLDPPASDLLREPPPDRVSEAPPTPAEAQRRYVTSGIWQLDPSPPSDPPSGDRLERLLFAAVDPSLAALTPASLPGSGPDIRPPTLLPPSPLGSSFDLDDRGLIRATPEGALSPDGVVVYLGNPPIIPGVRPGTVLPEPQPNATVEPETPLDPSATAESETPETPETETVDTEPTLTPEQERLRQFRPQARPASFDETFNQEGLEDGPLDQAELAEIRPRIRPPSIQEEVAADEEPTVDDGATELAIASSSVPRTRPASVARRAEKALADARAQAEAEGTPQRTRAEAADEERQVARAVVPTIPSRASVARAATEKNAIKLGRVNLIGVYGSPSDRRALVRLKSGRYVKVEVGDRVDGGRVAAIGEDELRYVKGGRNLTLKMPKG